MCLYFQAKLLKKHMLWGAVLFTHLCQEKLCTVVLFGLLFNL